MEHIINRAEYMDLDDALPRVGGNLGLYKRLLGRFVEGNHLESLVDALVSGDIEEAKRQAHSLKGVSANLSLAKIRTITVDLEQLLKDGGDYAAALGDLQVAYATTTEIITETLSES